MAKVDYKVINNETELIKEIDNLDKRANSYLMKIEDLYYEDLFFMSVIDKSIKLIDSFLFALNKRNITVLATLTRVQMDCAIRAFAPTMVNDSGAFCKSILLDKKRFRDHTDKKNIKLTDRHLCETLGDYIKLPVYDLYEKVCGFIHFSSNSFHTITKAYEENSIEMFISRNNRDEDKEEFERLSLELANQFYFFGSLLIEEIFCSWLEQKNNIN